MIVQILISYVLQIIMIKSNNEVNFYFKKGQTIEDLKVLKLYAQYIDDPFSWQVVLSSVEPVVECAV